MEEAARILIADCDETFLRSISELLTEEGYACDCVKTADDAKSALSKNSYDLSIADTDMPGNEALELVQHLQAAAETLPVILVTDHPSVDSAVQSLQLPVAAYLTKPLDLDEFLSDVKVSIQRSRIVSTITQKRQEVQEWQKELRELESFVRTKPSADLVTCIAQFQATSVQNISQSLLRLKNINDALLMRGEKQSLQLARLTAALYQTIDVLKTTKTAFKSKELGALRRSLERLLEEVNPGGAA